MLLSCSCWLEETMLARAKFERSHGIILATDTVMLPHRTLQLRAAHVHSAFEFLTLSVRLST